LHPRYIFGIQARVLFTHRKQISVVTTTEWLQEFISNNFPEGHEARKLKISTSTMHRWMLQIGAQFVEHQKSYYTDNHDSPVNVAYRLKYIEEQFELSLRQPLWTYVAADGVSDEALSHLRKRGIDPKRECIRGTQMYKVHVDFMNENDYLIFRKNCMAASGKPGLYYFDLNHPSLPILCGEGNNHTCIHLKSKIVHT
jgi:hypothetical protein